MQEGTCLCYPCGMQRWVTAYFGLSIQPQTQLFWGRALFIQTGPAIKDLQVIKLSSLTSIETYTCNCFALDNGPHYHNTAVLCYLAEVNEVFNVTLAEYNFFEAGEGKSVLDTHFAHISHTITRWVKVGNDIETGQQLADLIGVSNSLPYATVVLWYFVLLYG